MGRFVYRFEDQSRPLGKYDGAAQTMKVLGRLAQATLLVAGLAWLLAGDPSFVTRMLNLHG
ncbi:dGTP triphosphohydrolase [Rhodoblastus acidophilus]|uniref:hypothetical protein n=1 Tax=Rhodoblastus acidophilus TaxID=1074 RepID=UPI002224F28B|nr:hypothetical protein [Rhodoblastus acidophilus]MCW2282716.1 dGTP triphosphohydrolase [Rhodoblastus acidophilus]MCW2331577.1 dGTP triphosphohydrolase [Rhodoblastus acidophilus]